MSTINKKEIEKFSKLAKDWWNPNGKLRPLHLLNPARIKFIKEKLITHFGLNSKDSDPLKKINILDIGCGGGLLCEPLKRLGANITGIDASENNINEAKEYLTTFCKNIFHFGPVGVAAKAKLISNFLSLGTSTFVIETIKAANHFNIDLQKLYDVAKLGSGNSGALTRIAEKAVNGDYKGYIFSVDNMVKDLSYINDMLKDLPNAGKLSSLVKSFYKEASNKGYGNLLISELINK